jgi:hypothetical protein
MPILKGHRQQISVSNNHLGGYGRPSVLAATTLKNFLIIPLKATIFEKTHIHYINRSFDPLPPTEDHCGRPKIS